MFDPFHKTILNDLCTNQTDSQEQLSDSINNCEDYQWITVHILLWNQCSWEYILLYRYRVMKSEWNSKLKSWLLVMPQTVCVSIQLKDTEAHCLAGDLSSTFQKKSAAFDRRYNLLCQISWHTIRGYRCSMLEVTQNHSCAWLPPAGNVWETPNEETCRCINLIYNTTLSKTFSLLWLRLLYLF